MEFKDILETAKIEAIANTLSNTELSVWRSICRSYSQHFSTPLHLCLDGTIPMEDIILAEMERQLESFDEDRDLQAVIDQIYLIEDPTYDVTKKKDFDEFVKNVERKEKERIEKTLLKKEENKKEERPTRGFVNLDHLNQEEES